MSAQRQGTRESGVYRIAKTSRINVKPVPKHGDEVRCTVCGEPIAVGQGINLPGGGYGCMGDACDSTRYA